MHLNRRIRHREKAKIVIQLTVFAFFVWLPCLSAEEIHFLNGDRLTGEIVKETDDEIILKTESAGEIIIDKTFIEPREDALVQQYKESAVEWKRKISLGYSQSGGNTEKSHGKVGLNINRKTSDDEWMAKVNAYYSSTNKRNDGKKFYGLLRYAYSFGDRLKWYHFYKVEGDQDRFANIDYRIVPSSGVGYWFFDTDAFKAMAEIAVGFEHTNYRDSTKSSNEAILIPRAFVEKQLTGSLTFREDVSLYPSLKDTGEYRLHSETALINAINDRVAIRVSFIDDFNSDPSGSTKKNDYRLISSIDYAF